MSSRSVSFERFEMAYGDEIAAMNASEIRREFVRELRQRTVDQVLAIDMMNANVFLVSAKVQDILYRDELEFVTRAYGNVLSSRILALGLRNIVELRGRKTTRLAQGFFEPLFSNRLQEIADSLRIERLHRILVVRGREDYGGWRGEGREMTGSLDSTHARHSDIQKHDRRLKLFDSTQRFETGPALGEDEGVRQFPDKTIKALASVSLVVHDQHRDFGSTQVWYGKRNVTM